MATPGFYLSGFIPLSDGTYCLFLPPPPMAFSPSRIPIWMIPPGWIRPVRIGITIEFFFFLGLKEMDLPDGDERIGVIYLFQGQYPLLLNLSCHCDFPSSGINRCIQVTIIQGQEPPVRFVNILWPSLQISRLLKDLDQGPLLRIFVTVHANVS